VPEYRAPVRAITAALRSAGVEELLTLERFDGVSLADVDAVVEAFGTFAEEVLAPTDRHGDAFGARLDTSTGAVMVAPEVAAAFGKWVAGGWAGLGAATDHGGGGLPSLVALAAEEMFASANMALSLNPMLSKSAIHALEALGTEAQRERYLVPLVAGHWTGTMNITEPQAGSDVGAVATRAEEREDGSWAITGSKIFITWGEHDLAENIVHFVLARTPGAPAGTKGLSLFAVPRRMVADDGSLGDRNGVRCVGLEHKVGIHSSPTCVLEFDGAVGELVGEVNGGMAAMFLMMNAARLSVGLQGLGVSERAYQQALAYSQDRTQGRAPGSTAPGPSPIVEHPDVRRMLLDMRSSIDAMRHLLYATAAANDLARHHPDPERRACAQRRADLLTPLAKAWCTDEGVRNASTALQVHGGMGYIEETGVAQRYRDARIAPIYEGANGIQAIDLVSRKVRRDGGAALRELLAELRGDLADLARFDGLGLHEEATLALESIAAVETTAALLVEADAEDWLAGATGFLDMAAVTVAGALLARAVVRAAGQSPPAEASAAGGLFRVFALERLALVPAMTSVVTAGASRLDPALLTA
jgi:alkylation response protein AidB-like acyl-CoA dehydrogenase